MVDLGNVRIGLELDDSAFIRNISSIENSFSLRGLRNRFQREIGNFGVELSQNVSRNLNQAFSPQNVDRALSRLPAVFNRGLRNIFQAFRGFDLSSIINAQSFSQTLANLRTEFVSFGKTVGAQGVITIGAIAGIGVAIFGVVSAVKALASVFGDLFFNTEKNIAAFEKLIPLVARFSLAGLSLSDALEEANRNALSLQTLAGGQGITIALAPQIGVEAAQATASNFAEAFATRGLSDQIIAGSFLALEQIAGKGVVSLEELRKQLGERLPGALNIAAESLGLTVTELTKLVSTGGLTAAEFLPGFSQAFLDASRAVENPRENIIRLTNILDIFRAQIGEATLGVLDDLAGALVGTFGILNEFQPILISITAAIGVGLVAALFAATNALVNFAGGWQAVSASVITASRQIGGAISAVLVPAGLFTAAFAGISLLISQGFKTSELTRQLNEIGDSFKTAREEIEATNQQLNQTESAETSSQQRRLNPVIRQLVGIRDTGPRFEDDFAGRLVNQISFGLLEVARSRSEIEAANQVLDEFNQILEDTANLAEDSGEEIARIRDLQNELSQRRVELINLQAINAAPAEVREVQAEIAALSSEVGSARGQFRGLGDQIRLIENLLASPRADLLPEEIRRDFESAVKEGNLLAITLNEITGRIDRPFGALFDFARIESDVRVLINSLDNQFAQIEFRALEQSISNAVATGLEIDSRKLQALNTVAEELRSQILEATRILGEELSFNLETQLSELLGQNILDASIRELNAAQATLEAAGVEAGAPLAQALEKAIELKELERESLNLERQRLELTNQIQTQQLRNARAQATIPILGRIGAGNRQAVQEQINLAQRQLQTATSGRTPEENLLRSVSGQLADTIQGSATQIAEAGIELRRVTEELAATQELLSETNESILDLPIIAEEEIIRAFQAANLAEVLNNATIEQLEQVTGLFEGALENNPQLQQGLDFIGESIRLRDQIDQLSLDVLRQQVTSADAIRGLGEQVRSFSDSLADNLADAAQETRRLRVDLFFREFQNDLLDVIAPGSQNFGRRINELLQQSLSVLESASGESFSLENRQAEQTRTLQELTTQSNQLSREFALLGDSAISAANALNQLSQPSSSRLQIPSAATAPPVTSSQNLPAPPRVPSVPAPNPQSNFSPVPGSELVFSQDASIRISGSLVELATIFEQGTELQRTILQETLEGGIFAFVDSLQSILIEIENKTLDVVREFRTLEQGVVDLERSFNLTGSSIGAEQLARERASRQIVAQQEALVDLIRSFAAELGVSEQDLLKGRLTQEDFLRAFEESQGIDIFLDRLNQAGASLNGFSETIAQFRGEIEAGELKTEEAILGLADQILRFPELLQRLLNNAPAIIEEAGRRGRIRGEESLSGLQSRVRRDRLQTVSQGANLEFFQGREIELARQLLAIEERRLQFQQQLSQALRSDLINREQFNQLLEQNNVNLELQAELAKESVSVVTDLQESFASNLGQAFSNFFTAQRSAFEAVGDFARGILTNIGNQVAEIASRFIVNSLFGSILGGGGILALADGTLNPRMFDNLSDAVRFERMASGRTPRLAVISPGEQVLSQRTGDAQLFESLVKSGAWTSLKESQLIRQKVPTFAFGTMDTSNLVAVPGMSNSFSMNRGMNGSSIVINVTTPDANSFRASDGQIAARTQERLNREARRNN